MCFTSAIFREGTPDPIFTDYASSLHTPFYADAHTAVPESPLFCPRRRFFTLERSRRCTPQTLDLIQKLHELTDLAADTPLSSSTTTTTTTPLRNPDQQKRGILAHIRALPPVAALPDCGNDEIERKARWRYEAVRLAGLLYASSVASGQPLSTQSLESRLASSSSSSSSSAAAAASAPSLEKLVEAIKRSDCPHSECWGDMTGVLYWVTLVGGAAAARADVPQRRWLAAVNVRCAIVLAFEHRTAVVVSLRKMVEGMVRRG